MLLSSLLILQFVGVSGDKTCAGKEVQDLDDDCTKIEKNPLVFKGNQDEKMVREKVKNINYIASGIEVIETDLETFDYLKHVERIQNSNGPAMLFKKNKNLKRLNFTSLGELKGKEKEKDIVFENDHFAKAFREETDSFDDFIKLELIARKSHLRNKVCSNEFYQFNNKKESSDSQTGAIIMIVIAVIFTIVDGFLFWYCVKERRAKKAREEKKTNKVMTDVPIGTDFGPRTPASGTTTPSATIETPKDKHI
ncbi:hypothetical protein GCK72_015125 [Caenorhabditis remanei]|uniref:Receptor L-domain domain-containing protein n=1 Tax=Caenorhabditis remanei TaxID=31234 RepID=A0A6A5GVN0_CAERE|nr:hypothetical protein GCK72_015125 [Caenorhabditis remanei]KAF1758666.1 hypothetical protein GCK72_015125 [Caenorhabditis remanei]